MNPFTRILACAQINSAADPTAEKLTDIPCSDELFRFYSKKSHHKQVEGQHPSVPGNVRCFGSHDSAPTSVFHGIEMKLDHFLYVVVDETGQAAEPEVLTAAKTMTDDVTRVIPR